MVVFVHRTQLMLLSINTTSLTHPLSSPPPVFADAFNDFYHQSPSAAGNSGGMEDKKSPSTTASISGDESPGDLAAASGEGSEGGGVSVDGKGTKEGSASSSAEAASSTATAAPAPASGDAPAASVSTATAEDEAATSASASRWGGKKSFLDVSHSQSPWSGVESSC